MWRRDEKLCGGKAETSDIGNYALMLTFCIQYIQVVNLCYIMWCTGNGYCVDHIKVPKIHYKGGEYSIAKETIALVTSAMLTFRNTVYT